MFENSHGDGDHVKRSSNFIDDENVEKMFGKELFSEADLSYRKFIKTSLPHLSILDDTPIDTVIEKKETNNSQKEALKNDWIYINSLLEEMKKKNKPMNLKLKAESSNDEFDSYEDLNQFKTRSSDESTIFLNSYCFNGRDDEPQPKQNLHGLPSTVKLGNVSDRIGKSLYESHSLLTGDYNSSSSSTLISTDHSSHQTVVNVVDEVPDENEDHLFVCSTGLVEKLRQETDTLLNDIDQWKKECQKHCQRQPQPSTRHVSSGRVHQVKQGIAKHLDVNEQACTGSLPSSNRRDHSLGTINKRGNRQSASPSSHRVGNRSFSLLDLRRRRDQSTGSKVGGDELLTVVRQEPSTPISRRPSDIPQPIGSAGDRRMTNRHSIDASSSKRIFKSIPANTSNIQSSSLPPIESNGLCKQSPSVINSSGSSKSQQPVSGLIKKSTIRTIKSRPVEEKPLLGGPTSRSSIKASIQSLTSRLSNKLTPSSSKSVLPSRPNLDRL